MMHLTGRINEIRILEQFLHSNKPELLALYGRRRVGKTYLIRQFFQDQDVVFFNVTGSKDGLMADQIGNFTQQIADVFYAGADITPRSNWNKTFRQLTKAFELIDKKKKIVLFFDELPWMASRNSRLLQHIDYYWNQHWSNDQRIKFIVCGSSASWIIHKIINNKGGLYNRVTKKIHLRPFQLIETKLFLDNIGVKLNNQQILSLYTALGGIPYYLSEVEKGLSAAQIIERLAFSQQAFLLNEFDNLFASLFNDGDGHEKIVRIIGQHRYGIGKRKLLEAIGKKAIGNTGLKKLRELEETGFIIGFKPLYHKKKGVYYRLADEYISFYLKWIEPIRETLQVESLETGNWQAIQNSPEWYSWLGYAFESVCYKHLSLIRRTLKIPLTAVASSWRYVPTKGSKQRGAQIDLLFDRKDNAITICEIKYTAQPFLLTKEYVETLQRKITVFKEQTRTKKQIFLALISANGVKNNFYAEDILNGVVTLDDLFQGDKTWQ